MDRGVIFYLEVLATLILYTFPFIILLFNEFLFGINMVFLTRLLHFGHNDFMRILALFLTAIANYIAMIDHTTYCMNALYSVFLYLGVLFYGSLFLYSFQKQEQSPSSSSSLFPYAKILLICIADILLYSNLDKEWYLFACFVAFSVLDYRFKVGIYMLGFVVIIGQNPSLYYWMVYLGFYLLLTGLTIWENLK